MDARFEHPNRRDVLQTMAAAMAIPFQAVPARGTLRATAFDGNGKPAGARQLDSMLLIDADGRPFEIVPRQEGNGVATVALPNQTFQLMMRLPVRGFGEVYLYADGVRGPEALLNYEFARSRAAFVRRYVTAAEREGVRFSASLLTRLQAGEAAVKLAASVAAVPARVQHSNESLTETMWAGEMAAVERARYRIERQGPRPGFLFGCNVFGFSGSEAYRQPFVAAFNFGTVPFYRNNTERAEGVLDYSRVDAVLEKTLGTPLLLKGHPLLWFKRQNMPEFLLKKSWAEVKASSREYALKSVGRYRARIHSWDVINEAHDWANEFHYEPGQMVEITALMSQAAREADPTAFRVVNSCCLWAEYAATRMTNNGPLNRPSRTPLEYLRALRDARVDYDAIGLQIYAPGRDMLEIERHMDRFIALGKPIHITELGIPSANDRRTLATYEERGRTIPYPIDAVWHGSEWSEEIQADWVEQFYTLCYSKAEVQAVSWWDFRDPGYMPNGGLITSGFRPKESYRRLLRLIEGWRT